MSDEDYIRAEVAERVNAIIDAQQICTDADYCDKTAPEVRATAVAAVKGPQAIDGRSDDAIEAVFDSMVEDAGGDPCVAPW